jgi:competence ComEA-like helix-hairpin-helix protein
LVLVLAALAVATYGPLRGLLTEKWPLLCGDQRSAAPSWAVYEWSAGLQASRGEGFYPRTGVNAGTEALAARTTGGDPHLAIFTFRPIDLNRADGPVLQTIRGIGPKLAEEIVAYRLHNGPFRRLDDLLLIKGIGPAKLANLRERLIVGGEVPDEK